LYIARTAEYRDAGECVLLLEQGFRQQGIEALITPEFYGQWKIGLHEEAKKGEQVGEIMHRLA